MVNPKLKGRRSAVLKRCSTNGQVDTSIKNQSVSVEQTIADNDITIVKEIDLAGVTGSVPGARDDIDELIRLKRGGLDFDLLILPNTDRFTRAGQGHGMHLLYELEGEGIVVYFVAEQLFSDDRMHRMILGFMFDAAQQTAIAISRGATIGCTNSFLDGRMPHSRSPIYGLDRMYSVDGQALHVVRSQSDGTQQMLDPKTGEMIRAFGKNPKKGTPAHYIKQKNEKVVLIPGDPARVAMVHLIFNLVYIERRSFHSIAKQLNDAGVPSPRGSEWEGAAIKDISLNPTYVGLLRLGATTRAIYFKTAKGTLAASDVNAKELRDFKKPRLRKRPAEEWIMREDPILAEFLPQSVRAIARTAIEKRLKDEAAAKPIAPASKDRHRNSDFILKGVLRSKQGNLPMTGKRGGRSGDYRSYCLSRGRRFPKTNDIYNRSVPATPLEKAMLDVLREVLLAKADLTAAMRRAAEDHARKQRQTEDSAQIEKTLLKKQKQIAIALENLIGDTKFDAPIETKLSEYRAEVSRLTAELRSTPKPTEPINIDAVVEGLAEEFKEFGIFFDGKDNAIVNQMMMLLINRMDADLLTREVEVELAVPSWMGEAINSNGMMSLVGGFPWQTPNETHRENAIFLAEYLCKADGKRPICYICRRLKRTA